MEICLKTITTTTPDTLMEVLDCYLEAVSFQKEVFGDTWLPEDLNKITGDIQKEEHMTLRICGAIAAVFTASKEGGPLWAHQHISKAMYLRRVVITPPFRGQQVFLEVLDWCDVVMRNAGVSVVRMETWDHNHKLIQYYKQFGFYQTGSSIWKAADSGLPTDEKIALLERNIEPN